MLVSSVCFINHYWHVDLKLKKKVWFIILTFCPQLALLWQLIALGMCLFDHTCELNHNWQVNYTGNTSCLCDVTWIDHLCHDNAIQDIKHPNLASRMSWLHCWPNLVWIWWTLNEVYRKFDTCQDSQNPKWLTSCWAEVMDVMEKFVCLKDPQLYKFVHVGETKSPQLRNNAMPCPWPSFCQTLIARTSDAWAKSHEFSSSTFKKARMSEKKKRKEEKE